MKTITLQQIVEGTLKPIQRSNGTFTTPITKTDWADMCGMSLDAFGKMLRGERPLRDRVRSILNDALTRWGFDPAEVWFPGDPEDERPVLYTGSQQEPVYKNTSDADSELSVPPHLIAFIASKSLSVRGLASAIGVDRKILTAVLNGRKESLDDIVIMVSISKALGCKLYDIPWVSQEQINTAEAVRQKDNDPTMTMDKAIADLKALNLNALAI